MGSRRLLPAAGGERSTEVPPRSKKMRKLMSLSLFVLLLALGIPNPALAAGGTTHFKALGPDKSQARDDALFYPNDFEAAAAAHPDANNLVFFSLLPPPPSPSVPFVPPPLPSQSRRR